MTGCSSSCFIWPSCSFGANSDCRIVKCLFILFNIFPERDTSTTQWLAAVHLALSGHHVLLVRTVTAGLSNVCLYYLTYFQNESLLLDSDWLQLVMLHALSGHHVLLVQTVTSGLSNVCLYYLTYFQNESLLLDSDWPQFTDCFQNSVLVWVPCGWLWITLPVYLRYLIRERGVAVPVNLLNTTKTVSTGRVNLLNTTKTVST